MLEKFLDLIYPNVCGFCNSINKDSLCKKCEVKIKKYQIDFKKVISNNYYNELFCIFKYEDIIRDIIIKYKFENKSYIYRSFAKIIIKNKKLCGFLEKYDIIIPVPIHKKRKQLRGYNQTELIAKEFAKDLNIIFENDVLIKKRNTKAQSELTKKERKENIKNAFKVKNKNKIIGKDLLIFDDIYTTGSTTKECARILKECGANRIGILTIAKD